jgi:hypothetical protein
MFRPLEELIHIARTWPQHEARKKIADVID